MNHALLRCLDDSNADRFALPAGPGLVRSHLRRFRREVRTAAVSIKWVLAGEEHYGSDAGQVRLRPGRYLLMPAGVDLRTRVDSQQPVVGRCVYLPPTLESAPEMLHGSGDDALGRLLTQVGRMDTISAERIQQLGLTASRVVQAHCRRRERLSHLRAADRQRIYRRLLDARARMVAAIDQPIKLDELAGVAAMSPFHFCRAFRMAWEVPPMRFLAQLRMIRARDLIIGGDPRPLADIAASVGYGDLQVFSRAFRREMGVAPSALRPTAARPATRASR